MGMNQLKSGEKKERMKDRKKNHADKSKQKYKQKQRYCTYSEKLQRWRSEKSGVNITKTKPNVALHNINIKT